MKKTYSKSSRQGLPGGPNEMFEKVKGIIVSQRGQWDFPGMNTMVPTDDGRITMRGVPYPVYGQDETGYGQMMYPGQEYQFPGNNVLELPMAQNGVEKTSWVDYINPYNWGVTNRDDAGDFKKAFRASRIDGDDQFMWHGKRYSTKLAPASEEEKPKSNVLDLDNALDYLVETRGGTRDLWGHMADTIGYHESGHTMDPLQMQNSGGPGRGIFQFEAPSLITAKNRYNRIADRLKLKPDPKILSAKSALELSPEQQYSLFLINLSESQAKLKDYADNKLPLVDLWLQGHKRIEKDENRESFRTSVQKAKDKSIQKGYDSFKKLGGSLPRAQNGLTVSEIWEQQTGTPWSEARNKGYTSGSFQDNVKLRQQLLSGNFNNNVTQSTANTLQSQPLTNDTGVLDIKANDFNEAFKQARNTLGANKIFVWNGRKYGTNLKGEDFKPDEKTLSDAGLNDKQTKFRLEKENNALQDPYIGKSTVKLEGDWKDLEEVKTDKKEYEKSSQAERIVRYKNEIKDNKSYVIVDKEKGLLHIYKPGESKPIFTSGIDLGKNIGDDQTVTKALDTNKDGITTEADKVKNRWVVDWEKGSGTTGAGRYYVSNITKNSIEPGYEGYPSINMMNERQYDEFKKSGKIENISTSFHKGYVVDDNNRVSNGCIRCNKTTLNNLVQQLSNSSEVYILPEDRDEQGNLINEFVYENGKLNFRTKDYNKYLTYKDSKGQTQKGQGLNRTEQTLNYKPITLDYDPVRLSVLSKGTHDEGVVESFSDALSDNKQKIMKVAQINGDIYNEIAKMTFGILGAETNWGETFNIGENVVKGIGRMITGKVGGPDYSFKADVGRTNPDDSVGLTQLKWKWVSEGERKKLKELGITSSEDFLDPQKAAIGTAVILGIRYNEQLKTDQKANIWENLPPKWNNRSNYARRIKFNSAPVFVSEYTGDPKKGDAIKQNYKKETTKKLIENTIKQDSLKPFISESTGLNPLTRNINYQQINFPKQQLGGALPQFQYAGQFNPQLARPNPLTGKYAWEQSIPKKTAVNVAPKMQPAARATTNVQKQNLNLDRDNRLLDANLIYSDASSNPLSNAVHTGLDAVGMVPVIGEPADLANALLYNYEGDLENAALSTAGMIPFLGMLGTGKRLLGKAKKAFSQRGEDFGPEGLIPKWGDRANPKLLVQSPPEIKSVFKGVPHYGKDPALEAAKGALDVMKEQGRYLDNISFDASKLSPEQVKFHGIKHGRAVVEVALPNGNTQLFYKSSGLAGKSGAGVGNTTQDLWQPYGGHASNYASSNWFIKDKGFKDWYGSKSFRDISGNLDRIAAQGNYDLSGQLKAFKQLGGSLPKAQSLGQFNPQSFQPNPITGLYNWEKPKVKPTLSDFEPKQKAAPRSSTSVATKSDPVKAARQINAVAAEEYERNRQGVIRATNRPVSVFRPGAGDPEAVMEYTGVPSAIRIAQNPESVNDFLSGVDQLILGSSPVSGMMGMRRDFTPEETQALLDYSTVATMGLPLVRGAGKLGAQGLKQTGKYLTQGPLRNTYKYNPWAFKPNESNWYRQVGKSAIDDALETGLVREIGEEVSPRMWGEFQNQIKRLQGDDAILDYNERYMQQMLAGRRPNSPYFAKGELFYPMDKKVTMTKSGKISKNPAAKGTADYLIETDLPNESFQPAYVKGMYLGVPEEIGSTAILKPNPELRSLENFNLYKKNWWKGYKPINTPKQLPGSPNAFKSEIDWAKWNKEIPENKALMQEYNAIEQQAKADGSWMKNPDGSAFQGTPEQFVQQNSENFKNYVNNSGGNYEEYIKDPYFYHGSKNKGIKEFHTPQNPNYKKATGDTPETGIFITRDEDLADMYATEHKWEGLDLVDGKKVGETYKLYAPGNYANPGLRNPNNILTTSVGTKVEKPILTGNIDLKDLEYLQNLGYSGLKNSAIGEGTERVIFNPNAIKSATGNNGMFDMTNPNIYKVLAPVMGIGAGAYGVNQIQNTQPTMRRFGGNLNFQKGGIKKGGIKNLSPYGELQVYPTESGVGLSGEAGLDYQLPFGNSAYLSNSFNVEPGYGSYFNPGFGIEQPIGGNRGSFFIGAEMFDGAPRLNAGLRYRFEDGGSLPTAGDPVLNFIQRQSPRFSKSKK
jgi:hypothetical protein